jgi:RNA polymerase sigma-70 factor (ECF subfamily)
MRPDSSDSEVIEGSLTEPACFEVIFDRHYERVYAFLVRAIGPDGADLAQDVFQIAFQDRERFRDDADSAKPWLFGIARNVLRRWYRTQSRRRRGWLHLPREEGLDFTSDTVDRLSAAAMRGEIRRALRVMPSHERDVLLLFALGDVTYEEIAEAIDVPVGTVRSRLHRARQRLKGLLHHSDGRAIRSQERRADG